MKKICKMILITLFGINILGCNSLSNNSSNSEEDVYNVYQNDQKDFHLNSWIGAPFEAFEITELNEEVEVVYEKSSSDKYSYVYTTMKGNLADFSYVNLTIKGSLKGNAIRTATVRIGIDTDDFENNIIGSDYNLALTSEYQTFSLKIKGIYRTRLDLATALAIYPDIGKGGYDAVGNLYADTMVIKDVWFSTSIPEGVELANPNVDSGEDSTTTVNGWSTYSWCGYSMVESGDNTTIGLNAGSIDEMEWAYIEYKFEDYQNVNRFIFQFENHDNSITKITFKLRGDIEKYIASGDIVNGSVVEYGYNLYYEQTLLQYDSIDKNYQKDQNGNINIDLNISNEMQYFKEAPNSEKESRFEDGLSLVLLIESDPTTLTFDELGIPNPDGYGQMTIKKVELCFDEEILSFSKDGWEAESWTGYRVEGTNNGVKVSYNNPTMWGRINKKVEYNNEEELVLEINNPDFTCENMVIKLVGDEKGLNDSDPNNVYMEYYEYIVGVYDASIYSQEEEHTTLVLPLESAINQGMKEHMENGLQIWILIESDPNYSSSYDGKGEVYILSNEFR